MPEISILQAVVFFVALPALILAVWLLWPEVRDVTREVWLPEDDPRRVR